MLFKMVHNKFSVTQCKCNFTRVNVKTALGQRRISKAKREILVLNNHASLRYTTLQGIET